jgi:hypothetical protein
MWSVARAGLDGVTEITRYRDPVRTKHTAPPRRLDPVASRLTGRNRRLAKDFENLAETLANFVTLASVQLALRRLARGYIVNSNRPRVAYAQ